MSEILVASFMVSASLFVLGAFVLREDPVSVRAFRVVSILGQSRVREAAKAGRWLARPHDLKDAMNPRDIAALRVETAAVGLVAGFALALVLPIPVGAWLLPLSVVIAGYQAPALLLRHKLAARRRAVLRELPEVVSFLRVVPHRNLAVGLAAVVRTRKGLVAAAIGDALEQNATGVPLVEAMVDAMAALHIEELGRFVEVLSQVQATSTRRAELLREYEQELLARRREAALRRVETAEGKISAVLTVATAMQLVLLLVVPSLLRFLVPGQLW